MADQVQIPIHGVDANWKQTCDTEMERLKTAQFNSQDTVTPTPSQLRAHPAEFPSQKLFMDSRLYEAVEDGNPINFVRKLEQVCAEKELTLNDVFDQVDNAGDSLLHVAALLGKEHIAELIACHFPKLLTKINIKGSTALHVAATYKRSDVIKVILSQYDAGRSNSTSGRSEGVTSSKNDDETLTRLTNDSRNTALHSAVQSNHLDGARELFQKDYAVAHFQNKSGESPLFWAASNSNLEITKLLLEAPFPNDKPICLGNSPLCAVILQRNSEFLKKIVEERPDLMYLRDENGETPLHLAASIGDHKCVCILLSKDPLPAQQSNTKGHLPIHLASKKGHVKVVKEFFQLKWPIPERVLNEKGQNILHVAAKNGRDKVVKYLLKNMKFGLDATDKNGNTPLHLASKQQYPRVLYHLTRNKGTGLNICNDDGLTALNIIVQQITTEMTYRQRLSIMILSSAGARQNLKPELTIQQRKELPNVDHLRDRINILMLVAILITTVTFAAGFTPPGGLYSSEYEVQCKRGKAIFAGSPGFQAFVLLDALALYSSFIGCFSLMWAQFSDFHFALRTFKFALLAVGMAVLTMSLAFGFAIVRVLDYGWISEVLWIVGILSSFLISLAFFNFLWPLQVQNPFGVNNSLFPVVTMALTLSCVLNVVFDLGLILSPAFAIGISCMSFLCGFFNRISPLQVTIALRFSLNNFLIKMLILLTGYNDKVIAEESRDSRGHGEGHGQGQSEESRDSNSARGHGIKIRATSSMAST